MRGKEKEPNAIQKSKWNSEMDAPVQSLHTGLSFPADVSVLMYCQHVLPPLQAAPIGKARK